MEALELFRAGKLNEAIEVCNREVQKQPARPEHRDLLSQLLCFKGDLSGPTSTWTSEDAICRARAVVALIRQLIRAAQARQQFYDSGRVPEFLASPPPMCKTSSRHRFSSARARLPKRRPFRQPTEPPQVIGQVQRPCVPELSRRRRPARRPSSKSSPRRASTIGCPLECIRRLVLHAVESPSTCSGDGARSRRGATSTVLCIFPSSMPSRRRPQMNCSAWASAPIGWARHGPCRASGIGSSGSDEGTVPMVHIESLQFCTDDEALAVSGPEEEQHQ